MKFKWMKVFSISLDRDDERSETDRRAALFIQLRCVTLRTSAVHKERATKTRHVFCDAARRNPFTSGRPSRAFLVLAHYNTPPVLRSGILIISVLLLCIYRGGHSTQLKLCSARMSLMTQRRARES